MSYSLSEEDHFTLLRVRNSLRLLECLAYEHNHQHASIVTAEEWGAQFSLLQEHLTRVLEHADFHSTNQGETV